MNEVKNLMAPPLTEEMQKALDDARKKARARYGENKKITDGNYDKSLAVKCINGTFVGRKSENIIAYKGIPFTAKPPVGELRWKAPVEYLPDDGIYEAYYNAKSPRQMEDISEGGSLYYQSEDCLYLNVWKAEGETTGKNLRSWSFWTVTSNPFLWKIFRISRCLKLCLWVKRYTKKTEQNIPIVGA